MTSDSINDFFRNAEVRVLKRKHAGYDVVHLVRGFGAEGGRNISVAVSDGHPLYHSLAALAEHLAPVGQLEVDGSEVVAPAA